MKVQTLPLPSASRIKVLYIIGTLAIGGTERQLVELANGLDRTKFDPVVLCLSEGGPLERVLAAKGIPVRVVGLRNLRQIWHSPFSFSRLIRLVAGERPAIVHGLLFWAYILGAYAARLVGVPRVVASRRSLGIYKQSKRHYLVLERLANRMTDVVVANSEAVRRDVIQQEHLTPEKIVVIHNGVRTHRFGTGVVDRVTLGVDQHALLVGVLANLIHYKGHHMFLSAWHSVVQHFPDAVALLIGDGTARAEVERDVADLDLGRSVRLLGSRDDADTVIGLIDVLVHPSQQEGFSNAILEAMAAGKPVVATNVGGNPEAVVHEVTGLLVPPDDPAALASAIIRLLADADSRHAFGSAGRSRVDELFTIEVMIRRYENVYEELMKGRPAS